MIEFVETNELGSHIRESLSLSNHIVCSSGSSPYLCTAIAIIHCGLISYHSMDALGLYSGHRESFDYLNARKFLKYYHDKGLFLEKGSLGEKNRSCFQGLTKKGYLHLLEELRGDFDFVVSDQQLRGLDGLYQYTRRAKEVVNKNHYDGISYFMCLILSYGSSTFLLREFNALPFHMKTSASCYFRGDFHTAFRMDAYACLNKGDRTSVHIFYEQDTGSQSSYVLSNKLASYCAFGKDLIETPGYVQDSNMLLFGLLDGGEEKSQKEGGSFYLHKNSKAYRGLSSCLFALKLMGDVQPSRLLEMLSVLPSDDIYGFNLQEISNLLQTRMGGYKGGSSIELIRTVLKGSDNKSSTRKDVDGSGVTSVTFAPFIRRRNLILRMVEQEAFAEQFSSGSRICCVPNDHMKEFLPFILPYESGFSRSFIAFLSLNGYNTYDAGVYESVVPYIGISGINSFVYSYRGGNFRAFYENYSLDLSSRYRIPLLLEQLSTRKDERNMVVSFFLREDFQDIREFATTQLGFCCEQTLKEGFLNHGKSLIWFVCMEDFLAGKYSAMHFTVAGDAFFRHMVDYDSNEVYYPYIPHTASTMEQISYLH